MTLEQIKEQVKDYYYMEDDAIIDVALASIIANRLQLGDPVWLIIIGASSGGKSQILRPLSMTDKKYLHRIDDITENTFLSGGVAKGGKDISLLTKIGKAGMITISDLTVLFSRSAESRGAILSQFRMLYDGEMIKHVGNRPDPLEWSGYLGVIAGSTPSIYTHLEEVADMGERFMYYRMKPYNERKATSLALSRNLFGKELDQKLADLYGPYIINVVKNAEKDFQILPEQIEEIIDIATLAEKIRTINKIDKFTKEVERIPTTAMPMRTALQLLNIAKALRMMRGKDLETKDMEIISWLGLSLANEEKREILRILAGIDNPISTQLVADQIGLDTKIVRSVLQNLASTKVVTRTGESGSLKWFITEEKTKDLLNKTYKVINDIIKERDLTGEEDDDVF